MNNERYSHPSFGQIYFGRVNSNGTKFYGSELSQDHIIQMDLSASEMGRSLTRDWYYAKQLLARIRMSSGQFAELITSLNNGSGVCCTIEYLGCERVEQLPELESRKEFVHRKFEDRMKEFANQIKENQNKAKEIVRKKTLSKSDIHELTWYLEWLTQEISSNIPFFAKCFQETMDTVVYEAKTEVENAIQHKINVLGLSELHKQQKLLNEPQKADD